MEQKFYCVMVYFPGNTEPGLHEHFPGNDAGLEEVTKMERRQWDALVFVDAYHCQEEEVINNG